MGALVENGMLSGDHAAIGGTGRDAGLQLLFGTPMWQYEVLEVGIDFPYLICTIAKCHLSSLLQFKYTFHRFSNLSRPA